MRRRRVFLLALLLFSTELGVPGLSSPLIGAPLSRPLIAPPAEWVAPAQTPPPPPAADGASTIDLLTDVQTRFTKGGDANYYAAVYKIASPQGLDGAPLQVSWDPTLETLTIHRYRIIRDGKVIDLLGDGSKLSVIQREKDMENAALDGRLTATLQPNDVRVGDTIDLAFTRTRMDPALGGRSEALSGPSDGTPYGRIRVRFVWPNDKKMQWRAFPGVLQPRLTHTAAGNELIADASNVTTPQPPRGAPARFMVANAIDISEFPDWGAVSAAMLPYYAAAIKLGDASPVRAEARRIAAETSDPKHRAELALALVQEQIRYLFLGMNDGGYVPAAADLTWSRRFGDCKGKTVLLVALLRELAIEAEPVLVHTESGDLVANRLPAMGAFDHVIVRARIGDRTYWMDGTRLGDTQLDRLRTPPYHVGLPIAAGTKGLVTLEPELPTEPSETISLALDASAGIDAPASAKGELRFRGTDATDMRMKYAGLSAADRDQQLRELWRKNYDFVAPTSISTAIDERTGDFVITMTGTAKMDWFSEAGTRWYEVDRARVGWKFDTDRDPGALNKDAPFQVDYPDYWESRETIKLPAGGAGFKLQGGSVDQEIGGIYAFHRKVGIEGGVLTMESSTRALAPELPASKAEQTRSEMTALANVGIFVRVPDEYMATGADIAALQGNKKALVEALLHRGALHFDRNELAESLADENAVLAIDPANATAHSIRALALALQKDAKADEAADRAIALDSKQLLAWRAKGVIALAQKRYEDAEKAFSRQLEIDPKDERGLAGRGSVRLALGRFKEALADVDAALAVDPKLDLHIVRAGALFGLDRAEEALAEADRAIEAQPRVEAFRNARAEMREGAGKPELAIQDYDELIRMAPKADYYLARAALWTSSDQSKRDADIKAALGLDPHSARALAFRADAAIDAGDLRTAQTDIATIEQADRNNDLAYHLRLKLLQKQARPREALQLVDTYVAKHPNDANALNERCWTKATLNVELETALVDCNASLKLRPDSAATLDSRAFANLKLGATDAAIADYDAALKLAPKLAASLYGRAIARARKGDGAGARADIAEARRLAPGIDERFAGFGVSLPPELAASQGAAQGARN
jgi:tetratricopeptide (TPR) repeat protein/transglutaminase-like putative cysteine protease